tara:strand:- start:1337 stop:1639 length:303 start_codon:yes stop_codon:yes gene_type:complete
MSFPIHQLAHWASQVSIQEGFTPQAQVSRRKSSQSAITLYGFWWQLASAIAQVTSFWNNISGIKPILDVSKPLTAALVTLSRQKSHSALPHHLSLTKSYA